MVLRSVKAVVVGSSPAEGVPVLEFVMDTDKVLKRYGITKEQYEERFFWHEGEFTIEKSENPPSEEEKALAKKRLKKIMDGL